jgi:hypothetical protein
MKCKTCKKCYPDVDDMFRNGLCQKCFYRNYDIETERNMQRSVQKIIELKGKEFIQAELNKYDSNRQSSKSIKVTK